MNGSKSKKSSMNQALEELRRREELESLRPYLINEQCFPSFRDPLVSTITMEELKKLARTWKLNEKRNFWKNHSEKNDMVAALLQHLKDNPNFQIITAATTSPVWKPHPPSDLKSSSKLNVETATAHLKNVFGLSMIGKERTSNEIVICSRFSEFPDLNTNIESKVNLWRSEDFKLRDPNLNNNTNIIYNKRTTALLNPVDLTNIPGNDKMKEKKHRNLAMHLLNYSANQDLDKSNINMKTVQIFMSLADSEDCKVLSSCMIAISNISCSEQVRNYLMEINALHKLSSMCPLISGKQTLWAASLLFYYFSIDKEAEDRVLNSSYSFLQVNSSSKDLDIRMLTLFTLNNLMPSIDRQRVTEMIMKMMNSYFDSSVMKTDKGLTHTFLLIIQNMSAFSNALGTLMSFDVITILRKVTKIAVLDHNVELGLNVTKILQSFLQMIELTVTIEYINTIIDLLHILPVVAGGDDLFLQILKILTVLSCQPKLKPLLLIETTLIQTISEIIIRKSVIATGLAKDLSKFFLNITFQDSESDMRRLVDCKVLEAIINLNELLDRPSSHHQGGGGGPVVHTNNRFVVNQNQAKVAINAVGFVMKRLLMRSIQNIMSIRYNAIKCSKIVTGALIKACKEYHDIGAAHALLNICCASECRIELIANDNIHLNVLDLITSGKDTQVKSIYAQILVQLCSSVKCVEDLLNSDVINKLKGEIIGGKNQSLWNDVSLILLAIVALVTDQLTENQHITIMELLKIICLKTTPLSVIETSAKVLRCISAKFDNFSHLHPVLKGILEFSSDSESVIESISTVLYHMSCSDHNIPLMLQDNQYVNIMIRLMRKGKIEVQEYIAHAIRSLCVMDRCTDILITDDIISDLIVIAMLRTSSEEIKVVCSEAFYNMLCHKKTRLRLLEGDLWWALMRLCKQDSNHVRSICVRALLNLSGDGVYVDPLRKHHILSFLKDITPLVEDNDIAKCLVASHNIIRTFGNFDSHEVISSIRIGMEGLGRCSAIKSIRHALILLLRCSQQHKVDGMLQEFLNLDVIEVLKTASKYWYCDVDCCLYITRLLWELSRSDMLTKNISFDSLDFILTTIYEEPILTFEMSENIVSVFVNFVLIEKIDPSKLITMNIWNRMMRLVLSKDSHPMMSPPNQSSTRSPLMKGISVNSVGNNHDLRKQSMMFKGVSSNSLDDKIDPFAEKVYHKKALVLSLLTYCMNVMIIQSPDDITLSLLSGVLTNELMNNPLTRNNLLTIIHSISEVSSLSAHLVDAKIFDLLSSYLNNSLSTKMSLKSQEFCSTFLRNISLHPSVIQKYSSLLSSSICTLVKDLIELNNDVVKEDLSLFLYKSCNYLIDNDKYSMNPKFVLSCIKKICPNIENDKEPSDLLYINKLTVSNLLNRYNFTSGVDPSFLQSMFTMLKKRESVGDLDSNEMSYSFKRLAEQLLSMQVSDVNSVLIKLSALKKSVSVNLEETLCDESSWNPSISRIKSRPENIIIKSKQSSPVIYEKLEASDTSPPALFVKIIKKFDVVRDSLEGNAITEEGEDDDDDDEQKEEKKSVKDDVTFISSKIKNSLQLSTHEGEDYSTNSFEEYSNN